MDEIEVLLPEATPGDYLGWMAFWREVEQRIGELPALEKVADEESEAPFLHGDLASYLSSVLVGSIVAQANAAAQRGDRSVAPVLRTDPAMLREGVKAVTLRARWMTPERLAAMGVEPLDARLQALRVAVLQAVGEQLDAAGA